MNAKQDSKSNGQTDNRPDHEVPQPPPFQRKLQIAPLQLIGIPLLALLPLLSLFGVFGESTATVSAANAEVAMQVDYVARNRYKMPNRFEVNVTNLSQQSLVTITVAVDRAFIDHFSDISFVPDVEQISTSAYVVELSRIEPGDSGTVRFEMQGEDYGSHSGNIFAVLPGGQPVTVTVNSVIFP